MLMPSNAAPFIMSYYLVLISNFCYLLFEFKFKTLNTVTPILYPVGIAERYPFAHLFIFWSDN